MNYYTRDQIDSVREMCDGAGTIVSRLAYDPSGRTTTASGTILPTKQYAGMYLHGPSGLNLTRAGFGGSTGRVYKPNTGTWLSRDPLGEKGGMDLYSYVYNDPTRFTDALGLSIEVVPNPSDSFATPYNYPVVIKYHKPPRECCKNIAFVQTFQLNNNKPVNDGTSATPWRNKDFWGNTTSYLPQGSANPQQNGPQNAGPPSPFYPYPNPPAPDGRSMSDHPGNFGLPISIFLATTCAVCLDDPARVRTLECVTWGFFQNGSKQTHFSDL